jgi:hypothetical protein
MGTINAGDVHVDMVLARDVKNINGQLLMPKGLKISEKHLSLLNAWGITEVEIEGITKEEMASRTAARLDPKILAEAEADIAELFRHADRKHAAVQELFSQCVLRLARSRSSGDPL